MVRVRAEASEIRDDPVAREEPLEIDLVGPDGTVLRLATVLRTPGHDFELVAGFLYAEGLLAGKAELEGMRYCNEPDAGGRGRGPRGRGPGGTRVTPPWNTWYNRVQALLRRPLEENDRLAQRIFLAASGCGACGSPALPKTERGGGEPPSIRRDWLFGLHAHIEQQLFARTGGTHAAALFSIHGGRTRLHEDIGRHNAVDKIVGELLLEDALPAEPSLLWLSGRIGYELVQKAAQAGIAAVAALGAPTSLAVSTARRHGLFLAGFLSSERVNVYSGELT